MDRNPDGIFYFMNIENEVEIWKVIKEYSNYEVSNLGRVKSKPRNTTKGGFLSACPNRDGYLQVVFHKNGCRKNFTVHVLVAMAFHGHIPDGTHKIVVDHKDNNKLNNRSDNLKLISQRENTSKDKEGGTSQYIGVYLDKNNNKWIATIHFKGRVVHLGYFNLEIDAANAYQKALKELNEGLDLNIIYPRRKGMSSKFVGVVWHKRDLVWVATYKRKHIGYFLTEIEAYEAREKYIASLANKNNLQLSI